MGVCTVWIISERGTMLCLFTRFARVAFEGALSLTWLNVCRRKSRCLVAEVHYNGRKKGAFFVFQEF